MSRLRTLQTNFTAGEVSPRLLGRGDLRAYANGARRLANVFIHPTGGIDRRDGLYFVDTLPGRARLIAFEFNTEQTYLLAITDRAARIYAGDETVATLAVPWRETQLAQLTWTQSADTLLICHPEVEPRSITRREAEDWRIEVWPILVQDDADRRPFHRFAPAEARLKPGGTAGTITLTANQSVFVADHVGALVRIKGKQVRITRVDNGTVAAAAVRQTLSDTEWTTDWDEATWSPARGWPISATFHQDRLVVGGARDLPNRLWMSRSGDLFNFDVGTGLDDEAIAFPILSDQVNAVRAVFSGRHLQVFTSGAEWMVSGDPLTPETVQLHRQTRIGSPVTAAVPPRDIEGATLFVARNGRELREFLYADAEQAYRATDLALLAREIVADPVDQDYDRTRRLLFVVMADGTVGVLTAFRAEQVTAWTRLETEGAVAAVAVTGNAVYLAVQRNGAWLLERLDDTVRLDSAVTGSADPPAGTWSGLDHLEGRSVRVLGDGVDRGTHAVGGGMITLDEPVAEIAAGLAYTHTVEPLPAFLLGQGGGSQGLAMRPVETIFRLHETAALTLDLGRGAVPVPFGRLAAGAAFDRVPAPFTGDRRVRHLGWTRDAASTLWRVVQDAPLPFSLLSVTTELKVND
jgi:hypothetical protein